MVSVITGIMDIFNQQKPLIILDGGLATELEAQGHDLNHDLWSARLLIEAPGAIQKVHRSYLEAGADCITTATYQASLPGFRAQGLSDAESRKLIFLAVNLAVAAREEFWADPANPVDRQYPLVAASIGPYGAYLADGSEYRGDYDTSDTELYEFHRDRWQILAASKADLLACETIPSQPEVLVLLQLLRETTGRQAWVSFSCRDGVHLCDGTPLRVAAQACAAEPAVVAVGINCTHPEHISSLIREARRTTDLPILVYPNLGERYDATTKTWGRGLSSEEWLDLAGKWVNEGVSGVGGCCRIGPGIIAELRRRFLAS